MLHQSSARLGLAVGAILLLGACSADQATSPDVDAAFQLAGADAVGAVYSMTNDAAGNAVAVFTRGASGELSFSGTVPTGGLGSGGGLGNQGSLGLSDDNRFLFVVNAGSDEVSAFAVSPVGLTLVDRVPSAGPRPVSLTISHDVLYVLNAGGAGNIAGFRIAQDGSLSPIPGSIQPLSGAAATGAAQIAFSRDGRTLAVSEKATNMIDVYSVDANGVASAPNSQPSAGQTPFGLDFGHRGLLVVSEAFGGGAGQASASSYRVGRDGTIEVVTATLGNTQTAACWAAVSKDGLFAYTSNTPSGTISGYRIDPTDGSLSLVDADGRTAVTNPGDRPLDIAFNHNGRYLYVLNSGVGTVGAYAIGADGSLTHLGDSDAVLGAGVANGMAAW